MLDMTGKKIIEIDGLDALKLEAGLIGSADLIMAVRLSKSRAIYAALIYDEDSAVFCTGIIWPSLMKGLLEPSRYHGFKNAAQSFREIAGLD